MTRLRCKTQTIRVLYSAGLIGIGLFLSAFGGGSGTIGGGNSALQTGPAAIFNGASLPSAKSHWRATNCTVQVELTSDSGFYSVVVDKAGKTSSGGGHWVTGPDATSLTTDLGSGLGGFLWVSSLRTIAGSTSSQAFTANVIVQPNTQILSGCTFVLVQGPLP